MAAEQVAPSGGDHRQASEPKPPGSLFMLRHLQVCASAVRRHHSSIRSTCAYAIHNLLPGWTRGQWSRRPRPYCSPGASSLQRRRRMIQQVSAPMQLKQRATKEGQSCARVKLNEAPDRSMMTEQSLLSASATILSTAAVFWQ